METVMVFAIGILVTAAFFYVVGHWVGYQKGYDDKTEFIQSVRKTEVQTRKVWW